MSNNSTEEKIAFGKIRQPNKRAFLKAVCHSPNVIRAAAIAGIDRDNHYLWLKKDSDYAEAFAIAWERGIDSLEAEVVRRAMEGVAKPVFRNGKRALDFELDENGQPVKDPVTGEFKAVPAVIREYSDVLAIFTLNGNRSRKYRHRVDSRYVDGEGRDVLTLEDIRKALDPGNDEG